MKKIIIISFAIFFWATSYSEEYNILKFGSVGDGKTLNTESIQAAIDKATSSGGGKVIIPEGRFLTGSIVLKSDVELHVQKNAVLLGSTNPYHYKNLNRWKALILADGQQNISITGEEPSTVRDGSWR
jgi:polygalacturonase